MCSFPILHQTLSDIQPSCKCGFEQFVALMGRDE